jgi:hypothetical protein
MQLAKTLSPIKKHCMDQVAHIHGLDAVPTNQKDGIIEQLIQASCENQKTNLILNPHLIPQPAIVK